MGACGLRVGWGAHSVLDVSQMFIFAAGSGDTVDPCQVMALHRESLRHAASAPGKVMDSISCGTEWNRWQVVRLLSRRDAPK
jgi:hypothetical protein